MERTIILETTGLEFSVLAESAETLKVRGPSGRIKRLARPKKTVTVEEANAVVVAGIVPQEPTELEQELREEDICEECGAVYDSHLEGCSKLQPDAEFYKQVMESEELPDLPDTVVKRIPVGRRELPVVVTREEKDEASQKMCQLLEIIEDHEARKKEFTAQWKADLEGYQGDLNKNARIVRKDTVLRQVECEKEIDYEAGVARFYRRDTGEMFQERKLDQDEVQPTLDIEVAGADTEDGGEFESLPADAGLAPTAADDVFADE